MNSKKNLFWIYLFVLPCFIVFLLFYLLPIITVCYTSLTKWDGYNLPVFNGIDNYLKLFKREEFIVSMKNLLAWSIIASVFHVGYGVLIAFLLYKEPFGWKFVRGVYMIPNVISVAAWAVIYRFVFNDDFGIMNNMIRIVNPDFHVQWFFKSPYAFWAITLTWLFYGVIVTLIVLSDLYAIPKDLHESAYIDGANQWQITRKINLPLCRHAIGTGVILSITSRIVMYEQIALTTRGGPGDDTMNISLILVDAITNMKYGYANASAVVMFVLGILILLLVNKLFKMKENLY